MWILFSYIYLVCVWERGREGEEIVKWRYACGGQRTSCMSGSPGVELSSSGLAASILTCQVILLVQLQIITFWTFK